MGILWVKYEGNPVIKNEKLKDFRRSQSFLEWERRIIGHVVGGAGDHPPNFWQSPDLKDWAKVSEFWKDQGAAWRVWECRICFPVKVEGKYLESGSS